MTILSQNGKGGLSRWIEYALDFLMGLALVLTLTLRWSIPAVTHHSPGEAGLWYEKYLAVLVLSGVMAILILWQARGIMHIINKGNPFVTEMVRRLRIIGVECLVLAAFYFLSIFMVTRFFMVVVFVTFSVVGLILFVFGEIFRQAIRYKEENDMTI